MCKIILKFNEKLTWNEVKEHRESCEKGAGFLSFVKDSPLCYKTLDHKDAWGLYNKFVTKTPFTLFHSRLPSKGEIIMENVQPFFSKKLAMAHNGHITSTDGMMYALMLAGDDIGTESSDSLILFHFLMRLNVERCIKVVDTFNDNFVLVDFVNKKIYIMGKFKHVLSKDEKWMLYAWNEYTEKCFIVTTLQGKILKYEKEKPYVFQSHMNTYYSDSCQKTSWCTCNKCHKKNYPYATNYKKDDKTDRKIGYNNFEKPIHYDGFKPIWDYEKDCWKYVPVDNTGEVEQEVQDPPDGLLEVGLV